MHRNSADGKKEERRGKNKCIKGGKGSKCQQYHYKLRKTFGQRGKEREVKGRKGKRRKGRGRNVIIFTIILGREQ